MRNRTKAPGTLLYVTPPLLPGSTPDNGRSRFCNRCLHTAPAQGGIELSATRWCCASCWRSTGTVNPESRRRLLEQA